jgi:hypothetical protein
VLCFFFFFLRLNYNLIYIWKKNVSFLVALDAGSDLLWVPCDCLQCAPLSASYYSTLVGQLFSAYYCLLCQIFCLFAFTWICLCYYIVRRKVDLVSYA